MALSEDFDVERRLLPFLFVLVHWYASRTKGDNHEKTTDYRKSLEDILQISYELRSNKIYWKKVILFEIMTRPYATCLRSKEK